MMAYVSTAFLAAAAFLVPLSLLSTEGVSAAEFGSCDGCYCIPLEGETCPKPTPRTDFTDIIPDLKAMMWMNPSFLSCNPYTAESTSCTTVPTPLEEGGACVLDIIESPVKDDKCPTNYAYTTRTYPGTFEEATHDGERVTHSGACGLCSSLQDLAVYVEYGADLTGIVGQCSLILATPAGPSGVMQCLKDLGFTDGCAAIWLFNTINTFQECAGVCIPFSQSGAPPNGPPPTCELAECLQCDETKSGPLFAKFAGRTRRNSGLLSAITRPCSENVQLNQQSPCKRGKAVMNKGMGMGMGMMSEKRKEYRVRNRIRGL